MVGADAFQLSQLLGPLGGVVGVAFMAGAASGWGFCVTTILRITNKQITRLEGELERERETNRQERADCDREIQDLKNRVKEVEDRYTHGMERQLGQIRESSTEVFDRRGKGK